MISVRPHSPNTVFPNVLVALHCIFKSVHQLDVHIPRQHSQHGAISLFRFGPLGVGSLYSMQHALGGMGGQTLQYGYIRNTYFMTFNAMTEWLVPWQQLMGRNELHKPLLVVVSVWIRGGLVTLKEQMVSYVGSRSSVRL